MGFKIDFDDLTFNHFFVDFIENDKPDFVKLDRSYLKIYWHY